MEILRYLFNRVEEPDRASAGDAKRFAIAIIGYCADARASVTSWYRTALHNAKVGGRPNSRHLRGLAADVVYDEAMSMRERTLIADKYGLVILTETDDEHLTLRT